MQPLHVLWAMFVAALWGVNFTVIRLGLDDFPPILLNALRFAATGLLFAPFFARPKIAIWRIVAVGAALGAAKFTLLFIGMSHGMPAGLSSLVLQSQAFFTALFAAVVLGERPGKTRILGMTIAFAGLFVIALDLGPQAGQGATLEAFAFVIAAAACWGVANILIKQSGADDMLALMVWASVAAAPMLFAMSWLIEGDLRIETALTNISLKGVGVVAYLAIGATLIGFGLWGRLLKLYPAAQVAPFSLLVPVFGLSTAALVLGEHLALAQVGGAALVLLGLALNAGLLAKLYRHVRA